MQCLVAIGTGIVGKIAEYTVEPVGRQVGYVFLYNRNLKNLQSQVIDLEGASQSLERKIAQEERNGRKVETFVINWLTDVNRIVEEAEEFLKDEHQANIKCLNGFCPNLLARHRLSRKSTILVQEVVKLSGKKNFANIVISTTDYEAYDSRTLVVKKVMDELKNSDTYMIGVYGIEGVGKTTLVKEIYKQATAEEKLFDDVVMILDLEQNPSIERIQQEIAEKLGLELSEIKTTAGRARKICNRIKDKETLVVLDGVREHIDLEAVGLPRTTSLKILLTSRSELVLSSDMGTEKVFPLQVLDKEEAWNLFEKTVGDIVKNLIIRTVAIQIAEKYGGLPLLVVTVARSVRNRSLQEWKDDFRRLILLDGKGSTEETYAAIEWSYNQLGDEQLKSLFLLCGLITLGYSNTIYILDLFNYSMGLGLLKNVNTLEEARIALYSLLEKLKDSCLLLDGDANTNCRMPDLVGDVANRIMVRDNHIISSTREDELKDWPNKDSVQKCTAISFPHTIIPRLPEVLECPEPKMFILWSRDVTMEIPCSIFEKMEKLKVLDLTKLTFLPSLSPSLEFLKSLKTLCLDHCKLGDLSLVGQLGSLEFLSFQGSNFKRLPKEIGQLTRLRLLDLSGCSQLELIAPNTLSSLKRLEDLRMGNSFNRWEAEGVISTERSNANLEELKHLHQLTALQLHIPDDVILPEDLFTTKLDRFQICIGSEWKWSDVDETVNALKLKFTTGNKLDQGLKMLLKRTEDLYLEGMDIFAEVSGLQKTHDVGNLRTWAKQYPVLFEKSSFSKLEVLTFSPVNIWYGRPAHEKALFPATSTDGSLPHLRTLRLHGMEKFMRLWENTEPAAGSAFPKMETLEVKNSGLTNLELSAISFRNLTILEVTFCWRLQYLTTYSVARSLVQLITLKVDECKNMKEIFTSEGMGEDASTCEIEFSQLQSLELSDLVSLERFCSSNCRVTVPILGTLKVNWCPFKLKISSDKVLEVDGVQTESWSQSMSMLEQDNNRRLREELRAKEGNSLPETPVVLALPETGPSSSSTAKRTADLPVEVIAQLNALLGIDLATPAVDKKSSSNHIVTELTAQLEARRSELIAGSSQIEAECQEVMGREAELANIRQLIKLLEARAATLEAR